MQQSSSAFEHLAKNPRWAMTESSIEVHLPPSMMSKSGEFFVDEPESGLVDRIVEATKNWIFLHLAVCEGCGMSYEGEAQATLEEMEGRGFK